METSTISEREPQISRIAIQEAMERLERGEKVYFLDVRGRPDEYQIQGSRCYEPSSILSAESVELDIPKDNLIVTY